MTAQLSIVEAGPAKDPTLSQWFSPPELAREMVDMAATWLRMRPDARLLEPSAGRGNLVRAVLDVVPRARIDVVELDARWHGSLEGLGPNVRVEIVDYLDRPAPARRYHLAITNPPYDGGVEAAHLEKMLEECDRVIALLPARSLHGLERFERVWSRFRGTWWLREEVRCIRRPKFGPGGGTDEIVLLDMQRNCPGDCRVRWL
jgi:hypothetical protein